MFYFWAKFNKEEVIIWQQIKAVQKIQVKAQSQKENKFDAIRRLD